MKRVLSIFLALLLLLTSIPFVFSVSAASGSSSAFPELVITEMDLDSINVNSGAGPTNADANWAGKSWWNSTSHPSSTTGLSDKGDMMRYIEIYNASDKNINLYDYKIVVDTDAIATGSTVNTLDIKAGTVGSVTNPSSAILAPGEVAVLWIYNFRDAFMQVTFENFKGYYKWRYSGTENTVKAPASPDQYNYIDLSSTLVLAVDDGAAVNGSATLLGNFASNNIYYGLAKDSVASSEIRTNWTSWVLFEKYDALVSGNHADQSALNYLYGLDAHGDIREGRKFNEGRVTYNCNPGNLTQLQIANLPSGSNNRSAEIAISEINNISSGQYDYIELVNISGKTINVYDYCLLARYDAYSSASDYSSYYFNRVNYIIPGNIGNLQSYTHNTTSSYNTSMADYINGTKACYSNPVYAEGELAPGETAVLWQYETASYSTNGVEGLGYRTAADFRSYYGITDTSTKIFAMSGFTNEIGERNQTMGLSNSKCLLFGVARLDSFTRETTAEMGGDLYAEIKKEAIYFPNTTNTISGFPISKAENTAIVYPTMINGTSGKDSNSLGTNVAYQYGTSFTAGYNSKLAGFLHTMCPPDKTGDTVNTVPNYATAWKASPGTLMAEQTALVNTFPIVQILSHAGSQKTNIYTSGSSSVFDIRFIANIPETALADYDAVVFTITAIEPETGRVYFSNSFEENVVYDSLSASDKSGSIAKKTAAVGYYFAAHTITGVPANIEVIFNVEISLKMGNSTFEAVVGRYAYLNGASNSERSSGLSIKLPQMESRYLFVSDIHYMVTTRTGTTNRLNVRGYSAAARMRELQNDIRTEYYYRGLDAIFVLGDLSTDDWYPNITSAQGHTGVNRCAELYNNYLKPLGDELGIPVYVIKGNHDSYPDADWKAFSGLAPQFAVDDGNNVILMCDVYKYGTDNHAKKDGNYANGADYTGIDYTWLEAQLEKYKNRDNIFIASHVFERAEDTKLNAIIAKYPNVVCFLDAHSHHSAGGTNASLGTTGKYILNTGNYAYGNFVDSDFSCPCACGNSTTAGSNNCWWGYQIIETSTTGKVTTYHVTTARTYTITGVGSVTVPYSKTTEIVLK